MFLDGLKLRNSMYVDAMLAYHMKIGLLFCLAMPRIRYYYCGKFCLVDFLYEHAVC